VTNKNDRHPNVGGTVPDLPELIRGPLSLCSINNVEFQMEG